MEICIYVVAAASVLWPHTNWNMPHLIPCPVSLMSGRRALEQMNSVFRLTQYTKMVLKGQKKQKIPFKRWLHACSIMLIQDLTVTVM
jgi:hypothetical protein